MKTYVITLSKNFPAKHTRKGEPTNFDAQLLNTVWRSHNMSVGFPQYGMKLHTIRANYPLWKKRFEQIEAGKTVLSIRQWSGKPYHSKQIEVCKLTKADGIGLQKLEFKMGKGIFFPEIEYLQAVVRNTVVADKILSKNDGLSYDNWQAWFEDYDLSKPLAIIHFTPFRY